MEDGVWRTVGGRRIFIKEGQSLTDAMKNSGKFKGEEVTKENETTKEIDFKSFMRNKENIDEMKKQGIKTQEEAKKYFNKMRYEETSKNPSQFSREETATIIRENMDESIRKGWYVNADSNYKPKIEDVVLQNQKLRSAGYNVAYENYKEFSGSNISFEKFLDKEITVYRGSRGQQDIKGDVFKSYTYNENYARKWGEQVETLKITPRETLGNFQTTGEYEILVPVDKIIKN